MVKQKRLQIKIYNEFSNHFLLLSSSNNLASPLIDIQTTAHTPLKKVMDLVVKDVAWSPNSSSEACRSLRFPRDFSEL